MIKALKVLLLALTASTLVACSSYTQEIENPQGSVPAGLSQSDVAKAITQSLAKRGWEVSSNENGVIKAALFIRSHKAFIEIPYDDQKYAILYKGSENLKAKGNKIHNKYNHWVNNIYVDIKNNLVAAAHTK